MSSELTPEAQKKKKQFEVLKLKRHLHMFVRTSHYNNQIKNSV